jgi:hypothetical protein
LILLDNELAIKKSHRCLVGDGIGN